RVDVVVRRRRDEADPRRGVPDVRDVLVDLVAWQLATLARLRALGDLDLQLVGVDQVVGGDAEAARRHLLDRGAAIVAVRVERVAARVLTALTRVRLAAHGVHRDGERLVRLGGERAERHRAGREPPDDLLGGLYLLDIDCG